MNMIAHVIALAAVAMLLGCQAETEVGDKAESEISTSPTSFVDQIVEASCGQCQFGMEGNGCDLAVRIDGKSYYVDGSSIDDHGDAHSDDGLCNCIRNAKVTGEVKEGRFVTKLFDILPAGEADGAKSHNH